MSSLVRIQVADHGAFEADVGDTLLDAALKHNIDIPHDCRAGSCGTCRVRLVEGEVEGGQAGESGYVLACQCAVRSDILIALEDVPPVEQVSAYVKSIDFVCDDVVEVTLVPSRELRYLPGQYCRFRFAGFPDRAYSPTVPLVGPVDRASMRLHIRRVPGGRVSGALGYEIRPGHKVRITGPFGSAYLRAGGTQRLVLASSGTGFAPIWAIAHAALSETPDREIVVIVGARSRDALYMGASLLRLTAFPGVCVVPILSKGDADDVFCVGSPVDVMPPLSSNDLVYVCGAPGMVAAIEEIAREEGATCFADPFEPSQAPATALLARARVFAPSLPALARACLDGFSGASKRWRVGS